MTTIAPVRPFRTVLVPVDGSAFSEFALPFATAATSRSDGALYLARVHTPVLAYSAPMIGTEPVLNYSADTETRLDQADALQRAALALKESSKLAVHWAVLDDGPVAQTLDEHALDIGADLIVMSTHGRSGIARLVFGSVAAKVVRECRIPVLVVCPPESELATGPRFFRRIAILLDGSALAEQIIEPALQLGSAADATFELIRVVTPNAVPMAPAPMPLSMVDPIAYEEEVAIGQAYLERTAEALRARGVHVTTRLERATEAPIAVVELARRERIDCIAMATHGRSGLSHALLGSVADEVVRIAGLPVLLYRPAEAP